MSEMYETKQNGVHPQAKHSVLKTGFTKSAIPTTRILKPVLQIVAKRPKGSIEKKPGEHAVDAVTPCMHRTPVPPWPVCGWCTRVMGSGTGYGYWVAPCTGTGPLYHCTWPCITVFGPIYHCNGPIYR